MDHETQTIEAQLKPRINERRVTMQHIFFDKTMQHVKNLNNQYIC
jgi:hypothetical protein